ncbi:MAG: hypothetical protein HKN92_04445 [Chitinophagales bacterium]|nr:hypothetical protein [Chitinophagales bacterium]
MIYAGDTELKFDSKAVQGKYVDLNGESFYRIEHYDQMPDFFMTIVSDSDHWMFISSNGALSAGRKNPENALFPYYTDDKIHYSSELTGSKSIFRLTDKDKTHLWEPFSDRYFGTYSIKRNIYKNVPGNKLLFEEINEDLGLTFRYMWTNSERFGFVKKSELENHGKHDAQISFLDGIQNILPYGVDYRMQNERSTLLNAYKKNELVENSSLALYLLSSIPVDKAEPSESLKATTVWSAGFDQCKILLSVSQIDHFRQGSEVSQETDIRARNGAYFINSDLTLESSTKKEWYVVAELKQGPSRISDLLTDLRDKGSILNTLNKDLNNSTENLIKIIAISDGLQNTANKNASYRHFSNVLFNVMRGGLFIENYDVRKEDYLEFISVRNKKVYRKHAGFLDRLSEKINYNELVSKVSELADVDLTRNTYEYLPITFGRRHGDPSRPWNYFSIDVKDDRGDKNFDYQGNWRDIFQNWEALAMSFPGFIESMIFKFLNATTADGYNPYRINRNGFDWEIVEPDDPWSYIGYWGDHQIIYLQKLMELSQKFHGKDLSNYLDKSLFAFANVPYRIKKYEEILKDPNDTILFDHALDETVRERMDSVGMDGQLLSNNNDQVLYATLADKLLITLLTKLSNFIPEAGIWLNTQRPEWNDANNALVGNGVSMVTLYYIRRFLLFCDNLFEGRNELPLLNETTAWLKATDQVFRENESKLSASFSDTERRDFIDKVGRAGSDYRENLYTNGISGKQEKIQTEKIRSFFTLALKYIDHSIKLNKREDDLYHTYNLVHFTKGKVTIDRLYEMLEGQVAALSSGALSAEESVDLLIALRKSKLYWPDQKSYFLYPDRQLPRFMNKNNIPASAAKDSNLIQKLIEDGNKKLVELDGQGKYHFNGTFNNANSVNEALEILEESGYRDLVLAEKDQILEIFEQVFDHKSFTGRSGTFFGYEGLGCIYWHMVSKLLLAAQESCLNAIKDGADKKVIDELTDHYYDIRSGIGFNKSPKEYGAFPSDAYSHTPGDGGARQPGMTGQVKEDILCRFGELGVDIIDGKVKFAPKILKLEEFLKVEEVFIYYDLNGEKNTIKLDKDQLAFTFNQVPVIYTRSDKASLVLLMNDKKEEIEGNELSSEQSEMLFERSSEIDKIEVNIVI